MSLEELPDAPLPDVPPPWAVKAALAVRTWLLRLADRVVPAPAALFDLSIGLGKTHLLGAAARHGFADHLAAGPLDAGALARRTGLDEGAVHRCLRALVTVGVFRLDADGRFANNRLSDALRARSLENVSSWVRYFSSAANARAWADLDATLATGASAFDRVHGQTVWDWFEQHPDEREAFALAMSGLTVAHGPAIAALYPFREVRSVCDVGGGMGTLVSELLLRHPHLLGTLCDVAGVLELARPVLARRGVSGRVKLEPGSIFEGVPPRSEAYVLKNVLHDWDDEACVRILSNCRRAMGEGARLLLAELIVEERDVDGLGPLSDAHMLVATCGGRERSAEELARLGRRVGLAARRTFRSPIISVVELG